MHLALKFMKTGLSTLVTRDGFLIYVPQKWNMDTIPGIPDPQNSIINITKYPERTGTKYKYYH